MPREPGRPLRLFFETKSNLRRDQLELLVRAGVERIQPGIESFHDGVLDLMNKGATALGQVQLLKWSAELDLRLSYNVIIRSPGEKAEHYHEMAELLPYLRHLPPPGQVAPMSLQRFSPYHRAPHRHGIRNVRPAAAYRDIYPAGSVDLDRLAYRFEFDHETLEDAALLTAHRAVVAALYAWVGGYAGEVAGYRPAAGGLTVSESRAGTCGVGRISGLASRIYRFVDRHRSIEAVRRHFAGRGAAPDGASGLDPTVLGCLVDTWRHRRWAYRDPRGRVLAVLPRQAPAAGAAAERRPAAPSGLAAAQAGA